MTRSMFGRAATCAKRKRWCSAVSICTSWRRRSTRAWSFCSSAWASGLTKRSRSGVRVQHTGQSRQHARIQRVGLGQSAHRTGKVARRARVDHGHCQARGLQRTGCLELIAAGGFQDLQRRRQSRCLAGQLFDAPPRRWQAARSWHARCWQPPASDWRRQIAKNRVEPVLSLPSLSIRTSSSYNRSGCREGRFGSGAQCSVAGFKHHRGRSGYPSRSEA
ncbi:hypothetical protein SAMN04489710_101525 [Paracidovorax konjaci]|uniref:Uncharacterized protein n=1 Tax=Paracidovorax konjaci TaxID=32040 RepID=A0A1I1S5V6_9BURK|nr:hypothetical protein SAMN04489710_101525 [Paracidovorax konjaci]